MSIITLTTDSGASEFYVSMVKGKILQECPDATIVDISHHIEPFNIVEAAFVVKNSYHHFPEKTIHIIDVNSLDEKDIRHLAIQYHGHFFIGTDNGIFSMIFDEHPDKMVEINSDANTNFPLRDIFAKAACLIANGKSLEEIGKAAQEYNRKPMMQPAVYESSIRAMVIYIDAYENVILNVNQELFEKVAKGRNPFVSFRRITIDKISKNYYDADEGEPVCFFNSFGLLEIAMSKGKGSSMFGLKINDIVQIDFE